MVYICYNQTLDLKHNTADINTFSTITWHNLLTYIESCNFLHVSCMFVLSLFLYTLEINWCQQICVGVIFIMTIKPIIVSL